MAISRVKFYGKTIKGSRYIIRKNRGPKNKKLTRGRKLTKNIKITKEDSSNDVYPNKLYEQCPKSKDCTNDVYPKNKLYEYCPKSMGISGPDFYGRSFKRSRYIIRKNKKITRGAKNKKFTRGPKKQVI